MEIYSLLKDPWVTVEGQTVLSLIDELKRELTSHHQLSGKMLNAVAQSEACDDVLYQDKESKQYYLVHLTWAKEKSIEYPKYKVFINLEDFIKYCKETFQFNDDIE
ncbi:hypothetical protein HQN89_36870 [Paenibacillus frigoriresistens]|uniref:hypothetical protein n=1 Tax=Paenibacillus alginolyticus TaxID=59839 RepID=UPI0015665065|nr:hypothetical protein [Paenibacillus frigoriresistens]NRF96321.1 hypothetical protein [Paenibacillus frigoriresistens]